MELRELEGNRARRYCSVLSRVIKRRGNSERVHFAWYTMLACLQTPRRLIVWSSCVVLSENRPGVALGKPTAFYSVPCKVLDRSSHPWQSGKVGKLDGYKKAKDAHTQPFTCHRTLGSNSLYVDGSLMNDCLFETSKRQVIEEDALCGPLHKRLRFCFYFRNTILNNLEELVKI